MEKGETLVDTIRIWSKYSDVIVLRHPWEGSARLASDYASVPVVNGGDGGHEHPTQTLCDLFTLRKEKGTLDGLRVALCGDLKHGRTVHSLIYGLLRFGAQMYFVPGEGLELPEHVRTKIQVQYGRPIEMVPLGDVDALYGDVGKSTGGGPPLDAIYMTPSTHQLAMMEEKQSIKVPLSAKSEVVFYVTRMQVERDATLKGERAHERRYPKITKDTMKNRFASSIVLHPLPRVDEISSDMDDDARSKYFDQAGYGVPVRMALLSLALGLKPWKKAAASGDGGDVDGGMVTAEGIECENPTCVVNQEPQGCDPGFTVMQGEEGSLTFACKYCDWQNVSGLLRYAAERAVDLQAHPPIEVYFTAPASPVPVLLPTRRRLGARVTFFRPTGRTGQCQSTKWYADESPGLSCTGRWDGVFRPVFRG